METESAEARRRRRRRQEKRSEKDVERRIREVKRKEKERREEQQARKDGMAVKNNNTGDIMGAEMVDVGLVQGGGEGEAGQGPAGGEEQAHGSEEEEDELGQKLQDQAEDRRKEKEEGILARLPVNLLELTAEMAVMEGLSQRQHIFLIAGVT